MKTYFDLAERNGMTIKDMDNGHWSLYCDVKCEDCGKEQSLAAAGGINGKCIRCGGKCV